MKYRIFISSVQRELAKERRAIADYIRKDALFSKFFDVFLFEEMPASSVTAQKGLSRRGGVLMSKEGKFLIFCMECYRAEKGLSGREVIVADIDDYIRRRVA